MLKREHRESEQMFGTDSVLDHGYHIVDLNLIMQNRWTSVALLSAVWSLSPAVNAAEEPLSYAVGDKCYCNVPSANSLNKRMVGTPIGGQSVAQVCERIGKGPALTSDAGVFNYPVFDDAQCGHGPGAAGFIGLLNSSDNDSSTGPKWDLADAYDASKVDDNNSSENVAAADASENIDSVTQPSVTRFKSRYLQNGIGTDSKITVATETKKPAISTTDTEVVRVTPTFKQPATKPVQQEVASTPVAPKAPAQKEVEELSDAEIAKLPAAKIEPIADNEASVEQEIVTKPIEEVASQEADAIDADENEAIEVVKAITPNPDADNSAVKVPLSNALRLPPEVRASSSNFEYFSVLPVNYDFGGVGLQVAGSIRPLEKVRVIARAGFAQDYQEVLVGASYVITPETANRLSFALTGGFEFGRFSLEGQDIETSVSDSGLFARAKSRFVINNRFEVQGGLGFSSFFEGDPHVFGAAMYHLTERLDITSEVELGDNDSLGLGIRYYY